MRTASLVLLVALLAAGGVRARTPGAAPQSSRIFQLSLIREGGRVLPPQCNVSIAVYENRTGGELAAGAHVLCIYNALDGSGRPIPPLEKNEQLSPAEFARLEDLVKRAKLYDGGHVGGRLYEGRFETLEFSSDRGTVILAVTNNPTFVKDPARTALLAFVTGIEKRLIER